MTFDPTIGELFVQRLNNGWAVHRGRDAMYRRMRESEVFIDDAFVARTPEELAALIVEWATKQQDQPPKT